MLPTTWRRPRLILTALVATVGCTPPPSDPPRPPPGRSTSSHSFPAPPPNHGLAWQRAPALPRPRSNNAVAVVPGVDRPQLYSMLGIGPGLTFRDVVQESWALTVGQPRWTLSEPVPGPAGRLAATAEVLDGRIYLVGGYTVASDGSEVSVPDVDVFDPQTQQWWKAAPMPVPVDDAVSVVWRGRLVLVSGWHDRDNVTDVQLYDPKQDVWTALPDIPGPGVFGHAGAVVADELVYCDGVGVDRSRDPAFFPVEACYAGTLDPEERSATTWRPLPHHGHPARYRVAAGALGTRAWVVFAGGTDNPYNFNGTGYDGRPSHPRSEVFAWDVREQTWVDLPALPVASMDHRGLVAVGDTLWLIGGMGDGADVLSTAWILGPVR